VGRGLFLAHPDVKEKLETVFNMEFVQCCLTSELKLSRNLEIMQGKSKLELLHRGIQLRMFVKQ